jgi:hypothetical protein
LAYTAVASAVAVATGTTGVGLDDLTDPSGRVRASLRALGDAARRAATVDPDRARRWAGGSTGAEPSGALAGDRVRLRAAVDGVLEAAREIIFGWRTSVPRRDRMVGFGDGTATDWVHSMLAGINQEVVRRRLGGKALGPAAAAGLSFAQPASTEGAPAAPGLAVEGTGRSAVRRSRT